jgi:transcriptional regulator with XRE-family HTH domain
MRYRRGAVTRIARARGLSPQDVLAAIGLQRDDLDELERGDLVLSLALRQRLAEALGVDVAEIYGPIGETSARRVLEG